VFDALAPVSGFSAPNATWSVSFLFNANPPQFPDPGFSFAANFSNADIRINGASILLVPTLVGVNNAGNSGGMDIFFADTANGSNAIEFFGPQVFTGSELAPTIVPGVYMTSATGPSITGFSVVVDGTRTNQGASEFTITAIPLPPPEGPPPSLAGVTQFVVLNGPGVIDSDDRLGVRIGVCGLPGTAWAGATVRYSTNAGADWTTAATLRTAARLGTLTAALPSNLAGYTDATNPLQVLMVDDRQLEAITDLQLLQEGAASLMMSWRPFWMLSRRGKGVARGCDGAGRGLWGSPGSSEVLLGAY
jgi:hypothetical protein